jgi:hypothetical protein
MEIPMRALCLILAAISLVAPAHAEFVLAPPPASADSHVHTPQALSTKLHSKLKRPAPDPPLAGFGAHIPLSFAIRQIVPLRFQVSFADTVDKDAPVDWNGGKPWLAILSDALRPLGLMVSVAGATVTIAPPTSPR